MFIVTRLFFQVFCADSWPITELTDSNTGRIHIVTHFRSLYYLLVTLIMFFLPMIVTTAAYMAIVYRLWSHQTPVTDEVDDPTLDRTWKGFTDSSLDH